MRGLVRRNLRLQLIAGIIAVLAMPVLASAAQNDASLATETTLAAEFHDHNGRTQATLNVTVTEKIDFPPLVPSPSLTTAAPSPEPSSTPRAARQSCSTFPPATTLCSPLTPATPPTALPFQAFASSRRSRVHTRLPNLRRSRYPHPSRRQHRHRHRIHHP